MNTCRLNFCVGMIATTALCSAADATQFPLELKLGSPPTAVYVEIDQHIEEHRRGGPFGEEGRTTNTRDLRTCKRVAGERRDGDVPDGTRLDFTYDRLLMETQTFFGNVKFDTDVDDPDTHHALGSIFGVMLAKTMSMSFAPDLTVTSFDGMKPIYNAAEENAVDMFMLAQLTDMLSDESARFHWGDTWLANFPSKPVQRDDVWERTLHRDDVYMGRLKYTYSFMPYADKVLYKASIKSVSGGARPSRLFGMLITDVKGSLEGEAQYDSTRGDFTRTDESIHLAIKGLADGSEPGTTDELTGTRTIKKSVRLMTQAERNKQRQANLATRDESDSESTEK